MKININIKGYSQKEASIIKMVYEYKNNPSTVKELLQETVKITLTKYLEDAKAAELLKALSDEDIEEMARNSKVSFGIHYNDKKPNEDKAIDNALQCFIDGIVALFINDKQYEDINETITLKEEDSLTFIKLTFLAGRMWWNGK